MTSFTNKKNNNLDESYLTQNSNITKKKNLTPNEELKLGNFMKINHFIANQNIKQVDEYLYEGKSDDTKENETQPQFQDKLILQLKDLDKPLLKSCGIIYFNNEPLNKLMDNGNKKKKKKQNLSIQSMVLMGKTNNITGLEEKTTTYNENNFFDLDDKLNEIDNL